MMHRVADELFSEIWNEMSWDVLLVATCESKYDVHRVRVACVAYVLIFLYS